MLEGRGAFVSARIGANAYCVHVDLLFVLNSVELLSNHSSEAKMWTMRSQSAAVSLDWFHHLLDSHMWNNQTKLQIPLLTRLTELEKSSIDGTCRWPNSRFIEQSNRIVHDVYLARQPALFNFEFIYVEWRRDMHMLGAHQMWPPHLRPRTFVRLISVPNDAWYCLLSLVFCRISPAIERQFNLWIIEFIEFGAAMTISSVCASLRRARANWTGTMPIEAARIAHSLWSQ